MGIHESNNKKDDYKIVDVLNLIANTCKMLRKTDMAEYYKNKASDTNKNLKKVKNNPSIGLGDLREGDNNEALFNREKKNPKKMFKQIASQLKSRVREQTSSKKGLQLPNQ